MRKINMREFKVSIFNKDMSKQEVDYALKDSIIEIIFNPALKLNGTRLLKQNDLAKKVLDAEDELLLEDEEYNRLKDALEKVEGLGKNDVILVERVINAEKVEIQAK